MFQPSDLFPSIVEGQTFQVSFLFFLTSVVTVGRRQRERGERKGKTKHQTLLTFSLQVRCSAHCLPACSYTWHYGGDGSSKVVSSDGLLTLPAVTRQDAGTYTCHADNGVGRRVTQDLQLAVRCKHHPHSSRSTTGLFADIFPKTD